MSNLTREEVNTKIYELRHDADPQWPLLYCSDWSWAGPLLEEMLQQDAPVILWYLGEVCNGQSDRPLTEHIARAYLTWRASKRAEQEGGETE